VHFLQCAALGFDCLKNTWNAPKKVQSTKSGSVRCTSIFIPGGDPGSTQLLSEFLLTENDAGLDPWGQTSSTLPAAGRRSGPGRRSEGRGEAQPAGGQSGASGAFPSAGRHLRHDYRAEACHPAGPATSSVPIVPVVRVQADMQSPGLLREAEQVPARNRWRRQSLPPNDRIFNLRRK
jgi:hypothetical protein